MVRAEALAILCLIVNISQESYLWVFMDNFVGISLFMDICG